jgi:LysM repeat protein
LAQGILESQSGESELAKKSNNHFGIKCKTEWTGGRTYHDDDEKGECFRVYNTVEESYKDHSDFLKTRPNYALLFKLDPIDYEGWAYGLKKAGYATSTSYPQRLLKVIKDYDLQQYSMEAIGRKPHSEPGLTAGGLTSSGTTDRPKLIAETLTVSSNKTGGFPAGVFTINHSKVIFAPGGSSLLALANQYDLPLAKLLAFNELTEMDILSKDCLIFLERKMKKGSFDIHIAQTGETLEAISQTEGIRLESLLEYNQFGSGYVLQSGDKIYLRNTAPSQLLNGKPSK